MTCHETQACSAQIVTAHPAHQSHNETNRPSSASKSHTRWPPKRRIKALRAETDNACKPHAVKVRPEAVGQKEYNLLGAVAAAGPPAQQHLSHRVEGHKLPLCPHRDALQIQEKSVDSALHATSLYEQRVHSLICSLSPCRLSSSLPVSPPLHIPVSPLCICSVSPLSL